MALRTEAEDWLRSKGSDQWSNREIGSRAIANWMGVVEDGRGWAILDSQDNQLIGTVCRGPADRDFWTEADSPESALYLYKLMVSRTHAGQGVGDLVLDWACKVAALEGREFVRVDCWRTAGGLHRYYEERGFTYLRTEAPAHRLSGWLAQRPSSLILNAEELHPITGLHAAQV
jgi:GNAT superfamily N-acetyltransferase